MPRPRVRRFRFRLFVKDEYRPLRAVPRGLWAAAAFALAAQLWFHDHLGAPQVSERELQLPRPPPAELLHAAAFGDPLSLGRILMLNLQAFDNQQGVSILYIDLDYDMLGLWLDRIVSLDEKSEYPHFTAAKIYTGPPDEARRRKMAEWVRRHFRAFPDARWEWMAYMTNFVRHQIKDDALSLEMAREIRALTTPGEVPGWTRQMEVFFLENANEYESSAALLANLLEAGEVADPAEFSFLLTRLEEIAEKMVESGEVRSEGEIDKIDNQLRALREQFLRQYGESSESDS
ncbi:MAG: hypothetical protein ACR2QC_03590 [Gammaproteobacteria bacterium]